MKGLRVRGNPSERWFLWLLATFLVTHAGSQLVRPMVSYRGLQLGLAPADLGWLAASFSLAPLLLALSIGRLVDRYGELRFVLGGNLLLLAAAFAIAVAPNVPALLVLYAAMGLGHLTMVVAVQGLVARGSDEGTYDRRFAHLALSASSGQLIGPALGGLVAGSGSEAEVTMALIVGAVLCAAGLPCSALIRPPASIAAARRSGGASRDTQLLSILRMPGILRAILVSTTVLSAIDVIVAYLPALGEERLWTPAFVGGLLAVRAGASMASRIFLGAWSDRFGRRTLLAGSMAVAAACLVAMPLVTSEVGSVVLMAVGGFGLGIGQPVTMSWVAALASPGTRATALSVRLMGNRVGQMAVPVLAGVIAGSAGAGWVLGFTGLVVAGSLAMVYGGLGSQRAGRPTSRAGADSTTVGGDPTPDQRRPA
jgi:MFS family permease